MDKSYRGPIDRRWLVRNRSRIQHRMLRMEEFAQTWHIGDTDDRRVLWAVQGRLIGVVFSLWRAVFLIRTFKSFRDEIDHGAQVIRILIDTNAIGFPQDVATGEWTAGYYIENATLRLYALAVDKDTRSVLSSDTLNELETFKPDLYSELLASDPHTVIWERCLKTSDRVFKDFKTAARAAVL